MTEETRKPLMLFGMPPMAFIFDGVLGVFLIKCIFTLGAITERIETMGRLQQEQAVKIQAIEVINNQQSIQAGAADAHYQDIIRRLDDLTTEIRRRK
jgi:hypothetical protein